MFWSRPKVQVHPLRSSKNADSGIAAPTEPVYTRMEQVEIQVGRKYIFRSTGGKVSMGEINIWCKFYPTVSYLDNPL